MTCMSKKFVTSWSDGKTVPDNYIFPLGKRPGEDLSTSEVNIPVIDLGMADLQSDHPTLVQQIMEASQELGCFQVVNHGVPRRLMDDARGVIKELFKLPVEEKSIFYSLDTSKKFIMFTSTVNYDEEERHLWRDGAKLQCSPLEECTPYWPTKPTNFRETVAELSMNVNKVGRRILELIGEGLGLEAGHFANEISREVELNIHHYPASPDPSVTLGAGRHGDRSIITILMQDHVSGLQCYKDGKWIGVPPIPDAFVVIIGYIMQIASNGNVMYGDHRVVTNSIEARESAAFFICPTRDSVIEPAKALANMVQDRPLYRSLGYDEFLISYNEGRKLQNGDIVLQPFII